MALRLDTKVLQPPVVGLHCLLRRDLLIDDAPQHLDECEGMFGEIDFASEQRYASAVDLRIPNQLESIIRRPRAAAKNADD